MISLQHYENGLLKISEEAFSCGVKLSRKSELWDSTDSLLISTCIVLWQSAGSTNSFRQNLQ